MVPGGDFLRHTCASWLVMDDATLVEVRDLLGHRDIKMTLRYAHLAPERLRDAVSRLDKVFGIDNGHDAGQSERVAFSGAPHPAQD